jgi:hypothetical protein
MHGEEPSTLLTLWFREVSRFKLWTEEEHIKIAKKWESRLSTTRGGRRAPPTEHALVKQFIFVFRFY